MNSLREEIQERIILMMAADWGGTEVETTDDILKLIEKRIDTIRKEEEFNSYDMGWNMSLEKVKKEMLLK